MDDNEGSVRERNEKDSRDKRKENEGSVRETKGARKGKEENKSNISEFDPCCMFLC